MEFIFVFYVKYHLSGQDSFFSVYICYVASVVSDSVRPHRRQPTKLPVPGILQARTLEWVAISFSNAWKWKVKVKSLSHVRLLATPWTTGYQAPPSMGFSRQKYWSRVPLPSLSLHLEQHYLLKNTILSLLLCNSAFNKNQVFIYIWVSFYFV